MIYKVEFSKSATKSLDDLPKAELKKTSKRIDMLSSNPFPPKSEKLEGEIGIYRVRQGDYRILYSVFENKLVILILKIGRRREIYR